MHKLLLAICALAMLSATANAQCDCCPQCGSKVAVGLLKKTKKKVTTFEVECKEIAVPNICLPKPFINIKAQLCNLIGKGCVPGSPCGACEIEDCPKHVRNGQIRKIKVMKKKSVECAECSYKWEVTDVEKVDEYLYGKPEKASEESAAEATNSVEVDMKPAEAESVEDKAGVLEQPPVELVPAPATDAPKIGPTSSYLIRKPIVVKRN